MSKDRIVGLETAFKIAGAYVAELCAMHADALRIAVREGIRDDIERNVIRRRKETARAIYEDIARELVRLDPQHPAARVLEEETA